MLILCLTVALADTFQTIPANRSTAVVRQGMGVRLVHVWATWCGPCVGEFDRLDRVTTELGDQGLSVVALSIDASDAPLKHFLDDKRTRWRHYRVDDERALDSALSDLGGDFTGTVPYNLLLADDGTVLASWSGTTPEAKLRERVEPHLTGSGSSGPTAAQLAAVEMGSLTLTFAGREGDAVFIDNWNAGVLPLTTDIISGLHDLRIEGNAGTARQDQVLITFEGGAATVDLAKVEAPPTAGEQQPQ